MRFVGWALPTELTGDFIEIHADGLNGTLEFGEPGAEGWMSCLVMLRVFGFEANYACDIEMRELKQLRVELVKLYQGLGNDVAADWSAMESGIAFQFHLNRLGHLNCSYEFRSDSNGPSLIGRFRADQSHLPQWIDELDQVLNQKPAR